MIKSFKIFESDIAAKNLWNDFADKVNRGLIVKDPPDYKNIHKLAKMIPPSAKVLDVSIGDGANTVHFIDMGYNVTGTDLADIAIETIKKKSPNEGNFIVHDTEEPFPLPSNRFDLIFARLAIHYFNKESIMGSLDEFHRMLKPGGIIFIMVKTTATGTNGVTGVAMKTGKVTYTEEEWVEMVSNNFDIVDVNSELRKAYSFEKEPSNILEIIGKK